jgi:hypothetical protein
MLLRPDAFYRLFAGLDAHEVKKYLLDAKLLIPDAKGLVPTVEKFASRGKPAKFYVLAPEFASAA